MNTQTDIDIDLSAVPSRALEPRPNRKPQIVQAPGGMARNKGEVTITTSEPIPEGGDWTETTKGEGEVLITIGDHVPWTEDERRLVAQFGPTQPADEPIRLPDIEDLRRRLRDVIADNRERVVQATRIERWNAENAVLDAIEAHPGLGSGALSDAVRKLLGGRDEDVRRVRNDLLEAGAITVIDGARNAKHHHLGSDEAVAAVRLNRHADPEAVDL